MTLTNTCDEERERNELLSEEHLEAALNAAKKSIVLLKNENDLVPISKDISSIALIGPLADNKLDMNGTWSFFGRPEDPVTILAGIQSKVGSKTKINYAVGCNLYDNSEEHFSEAIKVAQKSEVIVLAIGESAIMNGEGASRSNIDLPGIQNKLVVELLKTGKPIVALVSSGRPLAISWLDEHVPAILATWSLGTQTGNGIAEVLFGDYNPSGKLPMTWPRNVGQVPIYYNYKPTGRLYEGDYSEPLSDRVYKSKYRDVPNSPLYPFGYGLSYTTFEYSDITLNQPSISRSESLEVSVTVSNTGSREGEEVVQLYIRDLVGSVTRPVKELKGFEKINLKPGETKTVTFQLDSEDLSFYRKDMTFGPEAGEFKVFVGTSSQNVKEASFELKDD